MQNIITQVPENNSTTTTGNPLTSSDQNTSFYDNDSNDKENGDSLIHLNIQENHYFITRDQLMSLPESLLLCLFPSGVFLDRSGQVISNLSPDDEVCIVNFPPDCFEYIMEVYTKAQDDLLNYPVEKYFDKASNHKLINSAKGFFGFGSSNSLSNVNSNTSSGTAASTTTTSEHDLLHQKPAIIVLREDLDYYCVPQETFQFAKNESFENNDDLLHYFMAQVKIAAGSYLTKKTSIFEGLFSSNRLKDSHRKTSQRNNGKNSHKSRRQKLGPAEQHLMDMLCSSGFGDRSIWGNRTQESGKTVISSLALCRLANESTQEFRDMYHRAKTKWELEHNVNQDQIDDVSSVSLQNNNTTNSIVPSRSSTSVNIASNSNSNSKQSGPRESRKKNRLATLADNVRSHSTSRNSSLTRLRSSKSLELPKLYDLVPKPDINAKLLLFWRKPARKCWWGEEDIEVEIEIYGNWVDQEKKIIKLQLPHEDKDIEQQLNKIRIPVRLHIRRVWTLELSVVGVQ